jgi:hypothetical protein
MSCHALALGLLFTGVAFAQNTALLGGAGESCRSRSDCQVGLGCVSQQCIAMPVSREGAACGATSECQNAELRCIQQICRRLIAPAAPSQAALRGPGPLAEQPPAPPPVEYATPAPFPAYQRPQPTAPTYEPLPAQAPRSFRQSEEPESVGDVLTGRRGYVGGAIGIGPFGGIPNAVSLPLSVRAGVWFDQVDLQFEVSPFTDFVVAGSTALANVQFNASVGYFIPFTRTDSFAIGLPLRGGIGLVLGSVNAFAVRADLLGLALRFRNVHLELNLPSGSLLLQGQGLGFALPLTVSVTFLL